MWSGGQSRASYIPDDLALFYAGAVSNPISDFAHMQVLGTIGAVVFDFYVVAIATGISRGHYGSVSYRSNLSAVRGRIISAQVGLVSFLYRVESV